MLKTINLKLHHFLLNRSLMNFSFRFIYFFGLFCSSRLPMSLSLSKTLILSSNSCDCFYHYSLLIFQAFLHLLIATCSISSYGMFNFCLSCLCDLVDGGGDVILIESRDELHLLPELLTDFSSIRCISSCCREPLLPCCRLIPVCCRMKVR